MSPVRISQTRRRLDRRVQFDDRSRAFPIRALLPAAVKPRSFTWECPVRLDQGREGACVGFSITQEYAARPAEHADVTDRQALMLYSAARAIDGLPDTEEGTSVLAGAKAAVGVGWWTEYRWAFSVEDLALAIGHHGPAVIGVNWYQNMLDPNRDGYLEMTGPVVGGHAILVAGYNVKRDDFLLVNSWGASWGDNGTARFRGVDMAHLLAEDGEACIPVRPKAKTAKGLEYVEGVGTTLPAGDT